MAFPSDVQLVTVTCGSAYSFFGDDVEVRVEVEPVLGGNLKHLVHKAGGTIMPKSKKTFIGTPGQPATFTIPDPSQTETWIDGNGAYFSGWPYSATITVRPEGSPPVVWIKGFTIEPGQTTIDLDLVPNGQIGGGVSAPVPPVTSVNGQTGAVEVEGEPITPESVTANLTAEAVDAKLPERLSESGLSATIGESVLVAPGAGNADTPLDIWDAYTIPTTYTDYMAAVRSSLAGQLSSGAVVETDRGAGSDGQKIYSFRAGHGPHRVLLVSGSHPNESHTFAMGHRWFEQFVTSKDPAMVRLRNQITVEWVACLVPSSYLLDKGNSNGVNINRNYAFYHAEETAVEKGATPFSEPESQIARTIINEGNILTLDLHARGPIGSPEVSWTAPSPWMNGDRALVWSTLRQWSTSYGDLFGTTVDLMTEGGGPLLANWAAWHNRYTTRQGAHGMTLESNTDLLGSNYATMSRDALRLMNGLITVAIGTWIQRGGVNPAPQAHAIVASGPAGATGTSITLGGSDVDTTTYTPVRFTSVNPSIGSGITDKIRFVVPFPCQVRITAYGTVAHVSGTSWRGTFGIGVDDAAAPNPSAIASMGTAETGITRQSFSFTHAWRFLTPDGETVHEARLFAQRNAGGVARIVVTKLVIEYMPEWQEFPPPAVRQV